ncbi:hypothetical protein [Rosistilla oblonga]|uniref:Uncharacterized protein n=1 Tax=Rosistilla oblonga TaxID=2527990 RepID=A0A518ISN3_9BACT|nr:hypothetical protein [Rosistilla oblonga]QDV56080.1 hypothetical protein Mal33_20590 [Rosistilla oblonga]
MRLKQQAVVDFRYGPGVIRSVSEQLGRQTAYCEGGFVGKACLRGGFLFWHINCIEPDSAIHGGGL